MERHRQRLVRCFERERVLDMQRLQAQCEGRSRRSLFRDLAALGYLTSFTHAGRYYTLARVAQFDAHGLWFYRDVGFSRAGTLKQTLAVEIEDAESGRTQAELRERLRVRAHNALLELVQVGAITRTPFEGVQLYLSADGERAAQQRARRAERGVASPTTPPATLEVSIEILAEALRTAPEIPAAQGVVRRLAARGVGVEAGEVHRIFAFYGLRPGKKRRRPPLPRSRR